MYYDWSKHASQPWRSIVTPLALPILIDRAKNRQTITYTELGDEIFRLFKVKPTARKTLYGQPVGAIGFAIKDLSKEWKERIPPLNALVVNAATKMPGDGCDEFVEKYLGKKFRENLTPKDRRALMQQAIDQVWDYPRWDAVANALGCVPLKGRENRVAIGDLELPPPPENFGVESKEHKALKAWVCNHPEIFIAFGTFGKGRSEHPMRSGDFLDAFFSSETESLAVEVKTSKASEAELMRGIFQVVKYRAVLKAEQLASGRVPNGCALLVTTQALPSKAIKLAERLLVDHKVVDIAAEHGT